MSVSAIAMTVAAATASADDQMAAVTEQGAFSYGISAGEYNFDYSKAQINAGAAYAVGDTGRGVTVAFLDSGVARNSEELANNTLSGYNAITNQMVVNSDPTGHGTFVAGLIASEGYGIEGTAYGATLYPVQVINASGELAVGDFQLAIGNGMAFVSGATIINNSWNSSTPITQSSVASMEAYYPLTLAFYRLIVNAGSVFVFAAGNQSATQVGAMAGLPYLFPQLQPGWLAVVATDSTGKLASYSNQCGVSAAWCLAAPGTNLISTLGSGYGIGSGTSFAAPEVSAALAILKQHFPYLSSAQDAQILLATANKTGIYADQQLYGQGLLDINAALNPVGAVSIPASNTISGATVTASSSAALGSASFAQSWSASVGPIMVLDKYNRSYTVDASAFAPAPKNTFNTRTATQQYGFGEMDQMGNGISGFVSSQYMAEPMGRVAFTSANGARVEGSAGVDPAYGFGSFATGTMPAGALVADDGVGNPFLNLADGANAGHIAMPLSTGFGDMKMNATIFQGYARTSDLTAQMTDPSYTPPTVAGGAVEFAKPLDSIGGSVSFNMGGVRENDRVLGGSTSGAFGETNNTTTYFGGLNFEAEVSTGLHFIGGVEFGSSSASQSSSALNVHYGTLTSESFHAGLVSDGVFDKSDKMGFVVSQPLRVSGGNVSLDVPEARDFSGNIISSHETVGAEDNGHETDLQGFYAIHQTKSSSIDAGVLVRLQPDNVKGAPTETIGLMRYSSKF